VLWLSLAFLLEAFYSPNIANKTQNITFTLRKSVSSNTRQDRHCTYNVTLSSGRVSIVAVEKQYYILCVCVFVVVLGIQHVTRMRHTVIQHMMRVFSLHLSSETFLFLRRIQRDTIKNANWSSRKVPVLHSSKRIFEKHSNIKFHENPSSGSQVPCGRTGRHDKACSRFSQFSERAYNVPFERRSNSGTKTGTNH